MPPTITALYAALNAIFNIFLANEVSRQRGRSGVGLGQGDDPQMLVAIRAHGNNAEFVPLAIIMLLLCELCGGNKAVLHTLGGLLFLGRVAHWVGLPKKAPNPFRFSGTAITWGMIVGASGYALYLRFTI